MRVEARRALLIEKLAERPGLIVTLDAPVKATAYTSTGYSAPDDGYVRRFPMLLQATLRTRESSPRPRSRQPSRPAKNRPGALAQCATWTLSSTSSVPSGVSSSVKAAK